MSEQVTKPRRGRRESTDWQSGDDPGPGAGFIVAAGVLVLIAMCGVVVGVHVLAGGSEDSTGTAAAPSSSACGLKGSRALLTAAPKAEWSLNPSSRMLAPFSKAFGPAETDSAGVHKCFAPGETGALFAAAHFLLDSQAPAVTDQALATRVVADEYKGGLVAGFADRPTTAPAGELVGFRVVSATDMHAAVELVWRVTAGPAEGALGATPVDLSWVDGDWLIQGTATAASTTVLTSMSGYTGWRAS